MDRRKRDFLAAMVPLGITAPLGLFASRSYARSAAQGQGTRQARPYPDTPNPEDLPKIDPKKILQHNQEKIQEDIEKLYALAGELKDQVTKTDATNVLSLPLIQKAEEIEKLAKQIKNLARG
jgi:peptidoglycan hydrolase CwlO-like protein